jgi:hypothetical protein
MAAFTGIDDLINKMTGGASGTPEVVFGTKINAMVGDTSAGPTRSALGIFDMWKNVGTPNAGTVPGTVAAPTKATTGALQGITNAGGARQKFLVEYSMHGEHKCGMLLYDRLLHIDGLNGTTLTAQTVGGTLTRNTGGEGNQIWIIHYGSTGTSSSSILATYTNQDGTGSRTTNIRSTRATNGENEVTSLPLQAGDTGVQSVQSVTFQSTATSTTEWGCVIVKPIAFIAAGNSRSIFDGPYPLIEDDACLSVASWDGRVDSPYFFALSTVES